MLSFSLGLMMLTSMGYTSPLLAQAPVTHYIPLLAYSELIEAKRKYSRNMMPTAIDCGEYSDDAIQKMVGAHVLYAEFACEPYMISGLQRREKDPRAIQSPQTTAAMHIIKPHLAVWENVTKLFTDGPIHGVYSTAVEEMSAQMHAYPHYVL